MKKDFLLRVYEDHLLYVGNDLKTELHEHFLICIIVSSDYFEVKQGDSSYRSRFGIIPPNYNHTFETSTKNKTALIYIEPESEFFSPIRSKFGVYDEFLNLDSNTFRNEVLELIADPPKDGLQDILTLLVSTSQIIKLNPHVLSTFIYVNSNIENKIVISEISKSIFISESRLRHIFKKELGVTISKYIRWKRLRASGLAILNGKNIKDSSYLSGFYDSSHFNKSFKEMFGINPTKVIS